MNLSEYAKVNSVSRNEVRTWIKNGFLPGIEKLANGNFSIPNDTPVPYYGRGFKNISRTTSLCLKVLEAADEQKTIYSSMFPKIKKNVFKDVIDDLIKNEMISPHVTTHTIYYSIKPEGIKMKNGLLRSKNSDITKLNNAVNTGITIVGAACNILMLSV